VIVAPLGNVPPAVTFNVDTVGAPVASPGRNDTYPPAVGFTAVTFNTTAVAPAGTTTALTTPLDVAVGIEPVTFNVPATPSVTSAKPRSLRVSNTRTGDTGTNELADDEPDVARTTAKPPTPTTDATTTPATKPRTPRKRMFITNSNQFNNITRATLADANQRLPNK
jgi:hypothetical protein